MSPFAQVEFLYLGTVVICGLILLFLFSEKQKNQTLLVGIGKASA